jgi:hypothetical protein
MLKLIVIIVMGALLGVVGSRYLFVGSWLSLIPWTIVGLAIGYVSQKRESMIDGVIYGFTLSFVFILSGYTGSESLISRVPFFVILGVFGGICGLVLGLLGFLIKNRITKSNAEQTVRH